MPPFKNAMLRPFLGIHKLRLKDMRLSGVVELVSVDKSDETEREDSLVIANIADFVTMAKKNRAPSTLLALQIISIACRPGWQNSL